MKRSDTSTRHRLIALSACVVAIAAIVTAISLSASIDETAPPRSSTSQPSDEGPAAATIVPPATSTTLTNDGASQTVSLLVTSIAAIASDPARGPSSLEKIAGSQILAEVAADSDELSSNGWTRVGSPQVVASEVVSIDGTSAVVQACVDSTDVQLLDSAGVEIPKDQSVSRSLNLFSLDFVEGAWRVTARSFPDNPNC